MTVTQRTPEDDLLVERVKQDTSTLTPGGRLPDGRELIVSLTTIAERLPLVDVALGGLLWQSFKPSRIVLWFSDTIATVPEHIRRFEDRGVTLRQCEDVGPHTKLAPALVAFPDAVIVTADDDTIYTPDWLRTLVDAYLEHPEHIHCHRAHQMRLKEDGSIAPYLEWNWLAPGLRADPLLFPTGVSGVLYPPGSLHPDASRADLFRKLAPKADDIWFKFMSMMQGTLSAKVSDQSNEFTTVWTCHVGPMLAPGNVLEGGNDKQLKACFDHYGVSPQELLSKGMKSNRR